MTSTHPFRLVLLAAMATASTLGCTATPPAATADVVTVDESVAPAADAPAGAEPAIPVEPSDSADPAEEPGTPDGSTTTIQPLPPSTPDAPPTPSEIEPPDPTLGTRPSAPETEDTDTGGPAPTPLPTPRPNAVGADPLTPQRDAPGDPAATAQQAPATTASLTARQQSARAQPVVLERGHVDLVEVTVDGTALRVSVKDDTQLTGAVFRSPSDVQLRVPDSAQIKVPAGPFDFLGPQGSTVHLLPQVQDPDLIWPGWNTERISAGQLDGDMIRMRLGRVDGPGPIALFTTDQFGSPSILFDSDGGGANQITVPIRTHAHANWSFGAPGVYRVTIEVAARVAGASPASTTATYVFLVGDAATPVDPGSIPPPQAGGASGGQDVVGGAAATVAAQAELEGITAAGDRSGSRSVASRSTRSNTSGALASTGASSIELLWVGVASAMLGVMLVVAGRRRRSLA